MRALAYPQAASLPEANQSVHTAIAFGGTVEQDRGQGSKSHTVRYVDFDNPAENEWLVARQFRVQGAKKEIIPGLVLFVNARLVW